MPNFPHISCTEAALRQSRGALLLDVRSPAEFARSHLPAAQNLPLENIPSQIAQLAPPSRTLLLYCTHGQRSLSAALVLSRMGYNSLFIVK